MSIVGNMAGCYSPMGKTFILTDENGNEFTGVVVDQETIFTANAAEDIRDGKIAATDEGVVTGSAVIPNYFTSEGSRLIMSGKDFVLNLQEDYDYTKFQAIICTYNTNLANSVAAEKVVINDNVYDVQTTTALSSVTKDSVNILIDFGITNTSGAPCLIRYFMYKEMY